MALTSFVQTAFTGGEISQAAQGRLDLPSYKISMNVCLNGIPIESGAWMRRPGTQHVVPTRGGARGRLFPFPFAQSFPYVMEFTDGFLRFTTGPALVMTNDAQVISAISAANPAVIQTAAAHGWSTGNSVALNSLGINNPLLQNRQFKITVVDTTHFSIVDAITGASIDGSTLGTFVSGNVTRILEIATAYVSGSWSSLRSVQAEARTVLLNGTKPQVLQVATQPTSSKFATFTYGASDFIDGPYLDPIAGSIVTPTALNGVITLTFSFSAYDSTRAYNIGDFVTFGGAGYKALTALNQNNQPDTHPANWTPVNGGAPVNGGLGFLNSDIGRLIRLLSEPPLWVAANTYALGDVVAFSDGQGGFAYWRATGVVAANIQPGTSTLWAINATGALWTWAQIVSVSGSGLIAPISPIGTLTNGGGLAAAFDGNTSKTFASSAGFSLDITTYPLWIATAWTVGQLVQYAGVGYQANFSIVTSSTAPAWVAGSYATGNQVTYLGFVYQASVPIVSGATPPTDARWTRVAVISTDPPPFAVVGIWASAGALSQPTFDLYIGQHYAVATAISSATLWPTNNSGIANNPNPGLNNITINLRAKNTAPASASDGTLLGTTTISNGLSAVGIPSSDTVTTWLYVWLEIISTYTQPLPDDGTHTYRANIGTSQAQFFAPNVANGSVITAQIRGSALLYNQTIRTWRLGVYSDTTGWPTSGTYHEGRVWFGGVVENRFDGSVSNGFNGVELDFTPTSAGGVVSDSNAISYICTGEDINQFLWMKPDQQGILCGTQAGEWLISAPAQGPITPTNIKAVRVTKIGCANIEPKRAEHTLLFVQKFGRKVMEYFADVFSGKFSAPNLSERAKHLTVNGIAEIAYQQELVPCLWVRRSDGALIGATYKRDTLTTSQGPNIIGWHRHKLGSSRLVESLCVGPSVNGNLDTVSMITNDPTTGIRHIELMTDLLDEGFALTSAWFLDDGIIPTSTVVQAAPTGGPYGSLLVNGLSVHNGKTVSAFIAGLDCGDYVVSNGSITVPFGDGVSGGSGSGLFTAPLVATFAPLPAVIGFTYNSDGQLVRPVTQSDTGAQAGPGFAKLGRQHRAAALLYGCVNGSIVFGTDFTTLYPAKLRFPNDVQYTVQQQFQGIWRDAVNSIIDYDGMISWRISRPLPAFVMAVGGFDSKADA
jgi:hypothetical protein